MTGCSAAAREAVFAGKDSSGPKGVGPLEIFFFHIPISRVGTCWPDTRQVFPGGFEVSSRNFFFEGI